MSRRILEWYGHGLSSDLDLAELKTQRHCPHIQGPCTKPPLRGLGLNGVCALDTSDGPPVAVCPKRMYSEGYQVLKDVAALAYGPDQRVVVGQEWQRNPEGNVVVALGQGQGGEVPIKARESKYSVDWVLAKLNAGGDVESMLAVEIQTIDTTGTYRPGLAGLMEGTLPEKHGSVGLNWENVSKRIIPQLALKGQLLRRERLCDKGIFFICPTPVMERILRRIGHELSTYHIHAGAITFMSYDLAIHPGKPGSLTRNRVLTTTVDAVESGWKATAELPEPVWGKDVQRRLIELSRATKRR